MYGATLFQVSSLDTISENLQTTLRGTSFSYKNMQRAPYLFLENELSIKL